MTPQPPPQWQPGQLLQAAREANGLSKRQASIRAGISGGYYRWVEYGTRLNKGEYEVVNPSPEALRAAAIAVGANPDEVLSAAGMDPTLLLRSELHQLINELPRDMVKPALRMVRGLVNTED